MAQNTALLQFVALALPAVAILMQTVIRFQDKYMQNRSSSHLRIEFRFLEITFLGLILAGILFSIPVFQESSSIYTRFGIILMSISFLFIFPAAWFSIRRPQYPKQSFGSPESFVKYQVIRLAKLIILLLPIGGLVFIIQYFQFFPPGVIDGFSVLDITLWTVTISATMVIIHATLWLYQDRVESSIASNWRKKLTHDLEDIETALNRLEGKPTEEIVLSNVESSTEEALSKLEPLADSAPEQIEIELLDYMNDFIFELERIEGLCEKIHSIEEDINIYEEQKEKAMTTISIAEEKLDNGQDIDRDDILQEKVMAENYIDKVEEELSEMSSRRQSQYDMLQSYINSSLGYIERIKDLNTQ